MFGSHPGRDGARELASAVVDPAEPDMTEPDLDAIAADLAAAEDALARLADGSYEHDTPEVEPS